MSFHPYRFYNSRINFWPAVLDMLAAALMVFVLSTYVQAVLTLDDPEMMELRERQGAFIKELKARMSAELAEGTLCFQVSPEAILIRFSNRVLFEKYKYRVIQTGENILLRFGSLLTKTVGSSVQRIQVEGHTDNVPIKIDPNKAYEIYPSNNWQLSSARATSVVLFLSRKVPNLPEHLFSANGFSSFRPIADNSTEDGRSMNRRVEIRLVFSKSDDAENGNGDTTGGCV